MPKLKREKFLSRHYSRAVGETREFLLSSFSKRVKRAHASSMIRAWSLPERKNRNCFCAEKNIRKRREGRSK